MMMSKPWGALKQSWLGGTNISGNECSWSVHKFAYLKQCDSDFASLLGSIISMLYVLMIQLQMPLQHSPLQLMGIFGRSKGSPLLMYIKFSCSKMMLSPAKTNYVAFTVFFLRSKKVFTKGVSRAGRLRVCLRRHLRKPRRRQVMKFHRVLGQVIKFCVTVLLHRNPVLQHEKQSILFPKNVI